MKNMIEAIKKLNNEHPIEKNYKWSIPDDVPIDIPSDIKGEFSRNIYLKNNLTSKLKNELKGDNDLTAHYWVIQKWGGISSFKTNKKNDERIRSFQNQANKEKLNRTTFNTISSFSKLAAFIAPAQYSIYDSRAVFSLNWLLFRNTADKHIFPQPSGRNPNLAKHDIDTLFHLSGLSYEIVDWRTAYDDYCNLILKLSKEALNKEEPYYLEMLLFQAAPTLITQDITAHTEVKIQVTVQ